jgi:hypothetical protein
MTKKHFDAMAAKFRELLKSAAEADDGHCAAGIICAAFAFCDVAAESNARFSRARFAFAAGLNCYPEWAEDARRAAGADSAA